jgi:hypothetical protein
LVLDAHVEVTLRILALKQLQVLVEGITVTVLDDLSALVRNVELFLEALTQAGCQVVELEMAGQHLVKCK